MLKTIIPASYGYSDRLVDLVDVHSGGIDAAWMRKSAAAGIFRDLDVKPDPKSAFIHLIAMGDDERYGCNVNGDTFFREGKVITIPNPHDGKSASVRVDCGNKDCFKTFETHAKVYREHNNKDPLKSEGDVVKAAHNDLMDRVELMIKVPVDKWGNELQKLASGQELGFSMSCVTDPTYPVCTITGYRPIIDIQEGDLVLTHEGTFKRVTRLIRRNYTGIVRRFKINGLPIPLEITADHPMMGIISHGYEMCSVPPPSWNHAIHYRGGDCFMRMPEEILPAFSMGDMLPSKIEDIQDRHVENVQVYNFEVEDAQSYSLAGLVSHNCRVPFDICSECGHKSKSRKDYCDHLKKQMTAITKSGRQIKAINDHMVYFDISQVAKKADQIAFGLLKAASSAIVSGAELAENEILFPPKDDYDLFGEWADNSIKLATVAKLAEMEKQIEGVAPPSDVCTTMAATPGDLPDDAVESLSCSRSMFPSLLGTLADVKITLTLKDFLRLLLKDDFNKVSGFLPEASALLPGIFSDLNDHPDQLSSNDGGIELGNDLLPACMRNAISNLIPSHSMDSTPAHRRIMIAVIKRASVPTIKNAVDRTTASETARKLAKAYAMYKVAVARRIKDPLATEMLVAQNYRG